MLETLTRAVMTTTMATAITNNDSIKAKLELKTEDNTEASMLIVLLIQTQFNIIYIVRTGIYCQVL